MWVKNIRVKIGQLNAIYIRTNSAWKTNMFLFKKEKNTKLKKKAGVAKFKKVRVYLYHW